MGLAGECAFPTPWCQTQIDQSLYKRSVEGVMRPWVKAVPGGRGGGELKELCLCVGGEGGQGGSTGSMEEPRDLGRPHQCHGMTELLVKALVFCLQILLQCSWELHLFFGGVGRA